MGIQEAGQIVSHPLKGALFESLIFSELVKMRYNQAKRDNLYFFRDNTGNEVDLILDNGESALLFEIKSGITVSSDFFKGLKFYSSLNNDTDNSFLVYGGDKSLVREGIKILSWKDVPGRLT